MKKAEEVAVEAAAIDAAAMEAAKKFYENAVRYGLMKYPSRNLRAGRNWATFVRIARKCITKEVPVDRFVDASFVYVMNRHPMVTAADICACEPEEVLRSEDGLGGSASPKELWNMLSCKLLDMVFALDGTPKSKVEILDNPMYGFPAWFRVFSPEGTVPQLILHWGDVAFDELYEDPRLSSYLEKKNPVTFRILNTVMANVLKEE